MPIIREAFLVCQEGNAFKGGMREEPVTWHGEIDELHTERDQAPTASIVVALYGTIIYLFWFARVLRTIIV